mmetsp:Transcript_35991/g.99183  ORF Transcript_35991/g.99183 Transcript_35991/m.99183 type:complete len:222 (-) Transcript_35991:174-839(-)
MNARNAVAMAAAFAATSALFGDISFVELPAPQASTDFPRRPWVVSQPIRRTAGIVPPPSAPFEAQPATAAKATPGRVGRFAAIASRVLTAAAWATLAALPRRRRVGDRNAGRAPLRIMAGTATLPASFQAFSQSTVGFMVRLSTLNFCKIYMAMLVLRITIMWFPNINPYRQPFYSMIQLTDPYLNLFRGWMPPIFGIDLSVILAFVVIQAVIDTLTISPY